MKDKDQIVIDNNGVSCIMDLQDFPHGELAGVRKDDKYDIEFYDVPSSLKVPSYNPDTGKIEWMPVRYWSIHRGKKSEIVTLSDGSQIYTDDDPRAVYGISSDAVTLEPCRFTPTEALNRRVLVPITTEFLAKDIGNVWYDFETGLMADHCSEHATPVDFSFGQFIGIMAGDGWGDYHSVYIADNEGFNIRYVEGFTKTIYQNLDIREYIQNKEDDHSRYGDTKKYRLNVGRTSFCDRIKELVDGHGDERTSGYANKRLPVWYQMTNRGFIEGLVCGMIATDGTVAVSNGKGKPQLRIQYTSTSMRLAREFQRCCRLLGVRSNVSFSKRTSGGNEAWNVTVSTIDAKKAGLLDRCCHERKRDVFRNTEVLLDQIHAKNDIVPFPKAVADKVVKLVPAIKGPKTTAEKEQYSICINVRKYAKLGYITRSLVKQLRGYFATALQKDSEARHTMKAAMVKIKESLLKSGRIRVGRLEAEILRKGVEACRTRLAENPSVSMCLKMLYSVRKSESITRDQAGKLADLLAGVADISEGLSCTEFINLLKLVGSPVRWEFIEKVEKTGAEVVGYDLTVPGYDTFVNSDGVVLSNTVNIHVPASAKASKEALDKMLPSKNLFSLTDMKSVRYKPEKEQVSGLWALTSGMTNKPVKVYNSKAAAIAAYRNGEISHNDPVEILK